MEINYSETVSVSALYRVAHDGKIVNKLTIFRQLEGS
jgi:hypothetical protein